MPTDNVPLPAGAASGKAASRHVTYSGELAHMPAVGLATFTGADSAKVATDLSLTNPLPNASADKELSLTQGMTGLRDSLVAQRYTVLADSLADGLAGFWTSTTANGGTTASTGGEGLVQTSANAAGSAQLVSTTLLYFPGQVVWFNNAARFNDTGSAGNIRRIGRFTVSGTTPQDGFYYELNGTTFNAVVVLAGTPTAVASGSWSEFSTAPFTLDVNFHFFEIRFTGNTAWFYVDNVLRHRISGTSAAITATLNLPMTVQSINTSGATNRLIAVRNIGSGGFGFPAQPVDETGLSAVRSLAVTGGTPHDSADSGNPIKMGARAVASLASATLVAAGDRANAVSDLDGAQIVRLDRPLGDSLSVRVSNTDGASTAFTVFDATVGSRNHIDVIEIVNDSTTNGYVDIRDGVAGAVIWTLSAPAKGGNKTSFHKPLRQPTANTALAFDVSAALTTVYISVNGFKSKA